MFLHVSLNYVVFPRLSKYMKHNHENNIATSVMWSGCDFGLWSYTKRSNMNVLKTMKYV